MTKKGRGNNPASRRNIGRGRPSTGRVNCRASLLPQDKADLKKLGKSRGHAITEALRLLKEAFPYMAELSDDPQVQAWLEKVQAIAKKEN